MCQQWAPFYFYSRGLVHEIRAHVGSLGLDGNQSFGAFRLPEGGLSFLAASWGPPSFHFTPGGQHRS